MPKKANPQHKEDLLKTIDYNLLYEQRAELLHISFGEKPKEFIDDDVIEGLINLCDALLDKAEEDGRFTFPNHENFK